MGKMTAAQKNMEIKSRAVKATTLPEGFIQVGDFSYAIPVAVDDELRYAVMTFTAKNNKATKTTEAFDPEVVRNEWLEEAAIKEKAAQEKAEEKARKAAERAARKSNKSKDD